MLPGEIIFTTSSVGMQQDVFSWHSQQLQRRYEQARQEHYTTLAAEQPCKP